MVGSKVELADHLSAICGSIIISYTASRGEIFPATTVATAVRTGRDTRYSCARASTDDAVATPSATCDDEARMSSSFSPLPSLTPTVLFRERFTKHVSNSKKARKIVVVDEESESEVKK